jgi:hypothetical protein
MASITENANSYKSIMKVTAEDKDSGLNGQVTYSILNQEPAPNMEFLYLKQIWLIYIHVWYHSPNFYPNTIFLYLNL